MSAKYYDENFCSVTLDDYCKIEEDRDFTIGKVYFFMLDISDQNEREDTINHIKSLLPTAVSTTREADRFNGWKPSIFIITPNDSPNSESFPWVEYIKVNKDYYRDVIVRKDIWISERGMIFVCSESNIDLTSNLYYSEIAIEKD